MSVKKSKKTPNMTVIRDEDEAAFYKRVKSKLEKLEIVRQSKLKIYKFRKKVGIPLGVILTPPCVWIDWMLIQLQRGSDDTAAGVTFLVLGSLYWWITQPKRQYVRAYKKDILPQLAKTMGLTYYATKKIPMKTLRPAKIVPSHDRYTSEDYFEGSYKGVKLRFSEIELETEHRDKDGDKYYKTVFKGLAILLDMEGKSFFGHTVLTKDSFKLLEWFKEKSYDLDRAHLVDPEFEKIFDVYTDDQVEARYLIDPEMVEELKALYKEYEGNKMMAAYYDNRLLVMIASKHNHFEPASIYIKSTNPKSFRAMRNEILQILSIIDKLELYDPLEVHAETANDEAANDDQERSRTNT